jgi:hypothetical protein
MTIKKTKLIPPPTHRLEDSELEQFGGREKYLDHLREERMELMIESSFKAARYRLNIEAYNTAIKANKTRTPDHCHETQALLQRLLAAGPVRATDVQLAATHAGISTSTLHRAKASLGVKSHRDGPRGVWYWYLPEGATSKTIRQETTAQTARADSTPNTTPGAPPPAANIPLRRI